MSFNRLELQSTPKWQDGVLPRTVAPIETYHRLEPLMPAVGITHVMEVTPFDHLGLPICVAAGPFGSNSKLRELLQQTLPKSSTRIDQLMATVVAFPIENPIDHGAPNVSAGKGLSALDSRVSAMMEAIERSSARSPTEPVIADNYRRIKEIYGEHVVDPRSLTIISPQDFDEDQTLEWTPGIDLCSGEEAWAPAGAATLAYETQAAPRVCSDTPTGLGAGNTIEEAVCHGLAEAIEHDAWTLALARTAFNAAAHGFLYNLFNQPSAELDLTPPITTDKDQPFSPVDLDSLRGLQPISDLLGRLENASANVKIHDLTSDIGIPVFSVAIDGLPGGPDGGGLGAHPDARLALIRAITEAAQQRLVLWLQNHLPGSPQIKNWQPIGWEQPGSSYNKIITRNFDQITSAFHMDVLEDIHYMLNALQARGYNQVIVINLTKPNTNIPVVKVIVPGLIDYWTSDTTPAWTAIKARVESFKTHSVFDHDVNSQQHN